jgi:L-methionine (R)-S-oxide reductase
MAEDLLIASKELGKEERYKIMLLQVEAIVNGETDFIANVSNIIAIIKSTFNHLWVGVYFVRAEELVLGPFQGPVACTRIFYGKGVCGKAWMEGRIIIVSNVDEFPGHISCSSLSKSEIVLPLIVDERVRMVLDLDSDSLNCFDEIDASYLSKVILIIQKLYKESFL